jgi:hypothetical protein
MRYILAALILIALCTGSTGAQVKLPWPLKKDKTVEDLEKERAKLKLTTAPVDRAKREITISDLLLTLSADAVGRGDIGMMEKWLGEYTDTILDAQRTMTGTGRDAHKKPAGFKDLEIALRRHLRQLDELGGVLSYDRRQPVEKARDVASDIRVDLLKALFGEENATSHRP